MASLFGNMGTNLALGAVRQADTNWYDSENQEAALLKQRQALVDKVAGEQDLMDKQAADIARTQNSYVQTYGIDPDMAYAIATNPNAKSMNLSELGEYIKSLKPTGQSTEATGPQRGTMLCPGVNQQKGLLGTLMTGPGAQSAPVYGPTAAAQPARKIYQPDSSYVSQSQRTAMIDHAMTVAHGDPRVARAVLEAQHPGASSWLPANMPMPSCKAAEAADRASRRQALDKIFTMISSGELKPEDAPKVLQAYNIDPKTVDLGVVNNLAKTRHDPATQAQVENMLPSLHANFPELNQDQLHMLGQAVVSKTLVLRTDPQTGRTTLINMFDPETPMSPEDTKRYINSMVDYHKTTGDIPADKPLPFPDAGTKQQFDQQLGNIKYVPGGVNHQLSRPVSDDITKAMLPMPSMLRTLGQLQAAANNDYNGIGIYGSAVRYAGGPAVSLLNGIDRKAGDNLNELLGVSNKANLRAMEEGFKSAYNMPNVRSYMLQGSAMGGGGGGLSNPRDIDQWFDGEHITSNIQSFNAEIDTLKSNIYRNYANYFNQIYSLPQDLNTNIKSVQAVDKFLIKQGFAEPDAQQIVRQLGAVQSGGMGK